MNPYYQDEFVHLRSLPDGSLTSAEVGILLDRLSASRAENERLRELLYQALTEGGIPPADYGVYLNHDTGHAFLSGRSDAEGSAHG